MHTTLNPAPASPFAPAPQPAMRSALEAALVAAKQATGEEASQPEARGRQLPSLRA